MVIIFDEMFRGFDDMRRQMEKTVNGASNYLLLSKSVCNISYNLIASALLRLSTISEEVKKAECISIPELFKNLEI
jgi:hypothetical protein